MSSTHNCIFCKLVSDEEPASLVHRDEVCTAFMDIHPVTLGHVIVMPNVHARSLLDLPSTTLAHVYQVAQHVALAIRMSDPTCEGINLLLADGEAAMQEIPHIHVHILPRRPGDGFSIRVGDVYFNTPSRIELDHYADAIRQNLIRPQSAPHRVPRLGVTGA